MTSVSGRLVSDNPTTRSPRSNGCDCGAPLFEFHKADCAAREYRSPPAETDCPACDAGIPRSMRIMAAVPSIPFGMLGDRIKVTLGGETFEASIEKVEYVDSIYSGQSMSLTLSVMVPQPCDYITLNLSAPKPLQENSGSQQVGLFDDDS